jgi:hypothetical protein
MLLFGFVVFCPMRVDREVNLEPAPIVKEKSVFNLHNEFVALNQGWRASLKLFKPDAEIKARLRQHPTPIAESAWKSTSISTDKYQKSGARSS